MFSDTTTKRLVSIENELRSQKASTILNYGALVTPDTTPEASWSGNVGNLINSGEGVNARWIAKFTRTDGIDAPPLVQFSYDYTLGKYYYDDLEASTPGTWSVDDRHAIDEFNIYDTLYEIGSDYVSWKIEVDNQWYYASSDGTTVDLTVQAISVVPGALTLTRTV